MKWIYGNAHKSLCDRSLKDGREGISYFADVRLALRLALRLERAS